MCKSVNFFFRNNFIVFVGCTTEIDIVFIMDGSGSIRRNNWDKLLDFVAKIIMELPRTGPQVGAIVFSRNARVAFQLDRTNNLDSARNAILNIPYPRGATETAEALELAKTDLFVAANGDRPGVPNVAIVITDGKSDDNDETLEAAEALHDDGVHVFSVGIGNNLDEEELRKISSPPQEVDRNYFISPDFEALGGFINDLLLSVCESVEEPTTTMTTTTTTTTPASPIDVDTTEGK